MSPRPPIGAAARRVVLSTKGTAAERDALINIYGSVYEGMRVALNMALGKKATPKGNPPPMHRHRRGEPIESVYHNGTEVKRWTCAETDCDHTLTSA